VALLGQSMPNWVVAYFSVVSKGLVIVPVLPDFTSLEILKMFWFTPVLKFCL